MKLIPYLKSRRIEVCLAILVFVYILYFSFFTIMRHWNFHSNYYDLAIMDQTVFNTFKGRFLALTDPTGSLTISRLAIHNDIILAALAVLYFIYNAPETLLVLQTVVLGFGAVPLFLIARRILNRSDTALILSAAYLMYVPLQRMNIFDFHAVALATTALLAFYYFLLEKKYKTALLLFVIALFSKEQVSLTTGFFGVLLFLKHTAILPDWDEKEAKKLGVMIFTISLIWFINSIWVIIPHFRSAQHFALERYRNFGDTPTGVISGILTRPQILFKSLFQPSVFWYFTWLFLPVGLTAFFAPQFILVLLPELAINLLSSDQNMRSIIHHYTAVLIPFIFIAAVFGIKSLSQRYQWFSMSRIGLIIILGTVLTSYLKGPLPYSKEKNMQAFAPLLEANHVYIWKRLLDDPNIAVSATHNLAPHFAHRYRLILFSSHYRNADYVLILRDNIINDWLDPDASQTAYGQLRQDRAFSLVYSKGQFEVYKKL